MCFLVCITLDWSFYTPVLQLSTKSKTTHSWALLESGKAKGRMYLGLLPPNTEKHGNDTPINGAMAGVHIHE